MPRPPRLFPFCEWKLLFAMAFDVWCLVSCARRAHDKCLAVVAATAVKKRRGQEKKAMILSTPIPPFIPTRLPIVVAVAMELARVIMP
jgi:hypothetical protein